MKGKAYLSFFHVAIQVEAMPMATCSHLHDALHAALSLQILEHVLCSGCTQMAPNLKK
jgi:hypothetical protein